MINIQFSHANGLPAESYKCLFKHIKANKINYIPAFGMERYKIGRNWNPLVDELINDIEQNFSVPIVGLGHSLGSVLTLKAAHKRPELFSRLIIMDPPIFLPLKRYIISGLIAVNMLHKVPHPANKAKIRRNNFTSRQEAFDYFKEKALFKNTKAECLQNYVSAGLKATKEGGFKLLIPRELEYLIFTTMPLFISTKNPGLPVDMIYSNQFEAMTVQDFHWVQKRFKYIRYTEMSGGHLFPLEKPEETAEIINKIVMG